MFRRYNFVLSLLLILNAETGTSRPFHTYAVKSLPKSAGATCQTASSSLASRFTSETGRDVFRSECTRDTREGYDITITYTGDESVPLVSTYKEEGGLGSEGLYGSKEICESRLPEEKARFQRSTGLSTFLSFCYRTSMIEKTPWAVRLDAFGQAHLRPYRYEKAIFGQIIQSPGSGSGSILADIENAALGTNIVEPVAIVAHDASETLVIRFFDDPENRQHRQRYFKAEELGKFHASNSQTTRSQCLEELQSAQRSLSFSNPVVWFCTFEDITWISRLYVFQIKPQELLVSEDQPFVFETYPDCKSEIDRVLAVLRDQGRTADSAICHWDDGFWGGRRGTFKMRVFKN